MYLQLDKTYIMDSIQEKIFEYYPSLRMLKSELLDYLNENYSMAKIILTYFFENDCFNDFSNLDEEYGIPDIDDQTEIELFLHSKLYDLFMEQIGDVEHVTSLKIVPYYKYDISEEVPLCHYFVMNAMIELGFVPTL